MLTFAYCFFSYNNGLSLISLSEISVSAYQDLQCLYNNLLGYLGVIDCCFEFRSTLVRLFNSLVIDHSQGLNSAGIKLVDNSTLIPGLIAATNLSCFV